MAVACVHVHLRDLDRRTKTQARGVLVDAAVAAVVVDAAVAAVAAADAMLHPSVYNNPDALAKLAALNPPTPLVTAAASTAASGGAGRKDGKRTIASSGAKVSGAERIGGEFATQADPPWLKDRDAVLENIIARSKSVIDGLDKPPITITLPNGTTQEGQAFVTSPFDVAMGISKGLANDACVASVRYSKRLPSPFEAGMVAMATNPDGDADAEGSAEWESWDMSRPLEGDCELELIKFGDDRGKEVFWHSSAHILGEALESLYGARLTHGPPTEGGFFYDSYMGSNAVTSDMMKDIEKKAKAIADAKQPLERIVCTKEDCLDLFASNPFKRAMIASKLPDGSSTTVRARAASNAHSPRGRRARPLPCSCGRRARGAASRLTPSWRCSRLACSRAAGLSVRAVHRPVQGAAPAQHGQGEGLQAAQDVERALAGQAGQRRAAARVRHLVWRQEAPQGVGDAAGGGREARPPQDWRRAGAPLLRRPLAGLVLLPAARHAHLQSALRPHPQGVLRARLPGGARGPRHTRKPPRAHAPAAPSRDPRVPSAGAHMRSPRTVPLTPRHRARARAGRW